MKKIIICMFAFTLLLSGCGSEDDKNIDENTGKEQLIVAMDCASAPYSYLLDTQGDYTVAFGTSLYASGYDVLVARDIAKTLHKELVIKKMSADKFAKALDDGDVDMVMGGLLKDKENDDISYSSSYYTTTLTMLVRSDSKFAAQKQLSQFKKAKVQGLKGTYYDTAIDQIKGVKHMDAGVSYTEMIKALKDKKVDAITLNQQMAELFVKQNADLKMVSLQAKKGFTEGTEIVIAFDGDNELVKKVNKALKKITTEKQQEYMNIALSSSPLVLK